MYRLFYFMRPVDFNSTSRLYRIEAAFKRKLLYLAMNMEPEGIFVFRLAEKKR